MLEHIEKTGIEQFQSIGACRELKYDFHKLISALKAGTLKDLPGTGEKPIDALAKVSVVSPATKENSKEETEQND